MDVASMERDMIRAAINDYDLYTFNQKRVLDTLVAVSIEGVAHISASSISKATNIAQNSTYVVLRALESEGCISRIKGQKSNAYKLSIPKMDQLVKIYHQKQSTLNLNRR